VDPQTIDINIHPTKTEIKFDDEHTIYAILRSAIKHSLGQFNIAPVLDFERNANLDTSYQQHKTSASSPSVDVNRDFNPFTSDDTKPSSNTFRPKKEQTTGWESLYVGLESKGTNDDVILNTEDFEKDPEHVSMFQNASKETGAATYQLHRKYVLSNIKSGMLVIDQHRAHQRILYEEFLKQITVKEGVSQQLLFPLALSFSVDEIKILTELKEQLEHTGFVFSKLEGETLEITGVPTTATESGVSIILEQLISDVENEVPDSNFSQTDLLAKSLAKSLSIKTGQSLTKIEQEYLVNSLFACKEPTVTPNNRLTFVTMAVDELDKKFM
jgi:DNA mismatch repair protein MutL